MDSHEYQVHYVTPNARVQVETIPVSDDETNEEDAQTGNPTMEQPTQQASTNQPMAGQSSTGGPPRYHLLYPTTPNPPATPSQTRQHRLLKRCQLLEVNLKKTLRTQLHRALTDHCRSMVAHTLLKTGEVLANTTARLIYECLLEYDSNQ